MRSFGLPPSPPLMRFPRTLAILALVGCSHSEFPAAGVPDLQQPFGVGEPLRLTYSPGIDRTPQWSTAPLRIMYAFDRGRRPDSLQTGCVSDMPASGGSRGTEICETDPTATLAMRPYWPARRADGSTAFVRQWWAPFGLNPAKSDLALQPPDAHTQTLSLLPIPYYSATTARTHYGISHPAWLDAGHLVYLARFENRGSLVSVSSGAEIVVLDIAAGLNGISVVPGTLYASSLDLHGDTLYYTLGGDSLVYRRRLTSGVVDTVFDFGALGIARDVRIQNGKLVAVVGGSVSFHSDPTYGMVQDDFGGPIYAADLPAGTPVQISPLSPPVKLYQHLALSPDGSAVIAEESGDLWRLTVP